MRVCPRYSHDAGPLYYKSGRPMGWLSEVLLILAINPLTLVFVYPSLLVWLIWRVLNLSLW